MAKQKTVGDAVGELLAGRCGSHCFGVLGSSNFKVTHAMVAAGIDYVAARHEGNAITMADAYARVSGELTLVSLHAGPGLTNAVTGLTEAAKSRTPLVVFAGEPATGDLRSNFAVDQMNLVRSVGAVAERIHSAETALNDAARAVDTALRQRCTVVLCFPQNIQEMPLPEHARAPAALPATQPVNPDPASVAQLADAILAARRPVIVAGRGALLCDAGAALVALAEQGGCLLANTACAHGIFAGQDWSLGICGGFSSPAASELISASDLLIGFGASFTRWTTHAGMLVGAQAKLVQVDIDPSRFGIERPIDLAVLGDARVTAERLVAELKRRRRPTAENWRDATTKKVIEAKSNFAAPYQDMSRLGCVDPRSVTRALDAILPRNRVVVTDAGHSMGWMPRYMQVPDSKGWCFTQSFQSIGLGLATAIGSGLAMPGRTVVAGIGDGGFMMSIADFETAVRLKLSLFILVYDDMSYLAEVHRYKPMGYDTSIVEFPDFDFAAMARGFGAQGIVVRSLDDLKPVEDWVRGGAKGVFVADAKITAELFADWISSMLARGGKH